MSVCAVSVVYTAVFPVSVFSVICRSLLTLSVMFLSCVCVCVCVCVCDQYSCVCVGLFLTVCVCVSVCLSVCLFHNFELLRCYVCTIQFLVVLYYEIERQC